jgi:hypothetical protein
LSPFLGGTASVTRRPIARIRILKLGRSYSGTVRIEVGCRHSTTGLTQVPGPMLALTKPQLITSAVFAHEERCGQCDTERAHAQGDQVIREQTDRTWDELVAAMGQRYVEGRRN